jgi:hypothetical protein
VPGRELSDEPAVHLLGERLVEAVGAQAGFDVSDRRAA